MEAYPVKICSHDYDNTIKLDVFCIDKCNYRCEYCFNMKDGHDRTGKELDLLKVHDFAKWLNAKTHKHILISLIGGEPTLHSQFVDFSKKTKDNKGFTVKAFTNFAKPYEFFKTTMESNVNYLLTFHYLDQNRADDFFHKLEMLNADGLSSKIDTINVMLLPESFNECLETYDVLFSKYGQKVRCNLIDDCDKDNIKRLRKQNYTQTQLSAYDDRCRQSFQRKDNIVEYNDGSKRAFNDYEIKNNIDFNFKHWKCSAGKDYFNIDLDGNIWPCNDMKTRCLATVDLFQHISFKETLCLTAKCPCEYGLTKERMFRCR